MPLNEKMNALEALKRLQEGNQRFVSDKRCMETYRRQTHMQDHVDGQQPFAIVLGCADSRVPVEIVFDQGLGDLFTIRVAGNIATPQAIGSMEYAVQALDVQLIVVLGHSSCGAVHASYEAVKQSTRSDSDNLNSILDVINPCFSEVSFDEAESEQVIATGIRKNVSTAMQDIVQNSNLLTERLAANALTIVGAEFSLNNGRVDFFQSLGAIDVSLLKYSECSS